MGVVTGGILMICGACIALGIIHFRFWLAERARRDELAFSIVCFSVAAFAACELLMMHAATPEDYHRYAWWSQVIGNSQLIFIAWFAYINLNGRYWLFLTYCALRLLALIIHLIIPGGINFREVKAVGHVTVLGETVGYPIAVPNRWMLLAHISHAVLVIFCLDASVREWRSGERRKALVFGTGVLLFGMTILVCSVAVLWGFIAFPILVSFSILFVIAAMVYELDHEMQSSAKLSKKLLERETTLTETVKQLNLSASAANVGMWTRKIGEDKIWVSAKAGEIWGLPGGLQFTREEFFQTIHPEDRPLVLSNIRELEEGKSEFWLEYRLIATNGEIRWVESRGKVEMIDGARFIRGAIVDITKRKFAEEAVHELSRRLMNAQEKERARLARELHDDLSQSLAMLSIELSQLRNELPADVHIKEQIEHLVSEIARVAAHVRRISHELHPARLRQLGLETALRGFCSEITAAHPLKVDFEAENLPRQLPDEVSLCLYRVTQEALQNVVKHSGATNAHVGINLEKDIVHLLISDNGSGFNSNSGKTKESLGLISIDERIRAVKGTVKINSAIGAGTKIEAHVPVSQS
jgi:PAS domain S-box-containing protein